MVTIPVELSIEQIIQAIRRMPADQQRKVLGELEDLFFGPLITETEGDEVLSREAALAYVEQVEAQETA